MSRKYGFLIEDYDTGSIETLMTGDGKTIFTDVVFDDGCVAIGMSYGQGKGVGAIEDYPAGTLATDLDVKWQVKFETEASIDAMIETLIRVKGRLPPAPLSEEER